MARTVLVLFSLLVVGIPTPQAQSRLFVAARGSGFLFRQRKTPHPRRSNCTASVRVSIGLTGGLLVFVRVTRHLTVAPDFRMTTGFITNDRYTVLRSGVRAISQIDLSRLAAPF
jgi:hypothetical protein